MGHNKLSPVLQYYVASCGAAVIYMAQKFFGLNKTRVRVRELCGARPYGHGQTHREFLASARRVGLSAVPHRCVSWRKLKHLYESKRFNRCGRKQLVAVSYMLHGTKGHFSLVYKMTESSITICDPATAEFKRYGKNEFLNLWHDCDKSYPRKSSDIHLRWAAVLSLPAKA